MTTVYIVWTMERGRIDEVIGVYRTQRAARDAGVLAMLRPGMDMDEARRLAAVKIAIAPRTLKG